jgi:hypothetical protein
MSRYTTVALFISTIALGLSELAAEPTNFAGEYADKNFLKGKGVFQMSLEQNGNTVSVFFSAAPEADGTGKVTSKGAVEFKWDDSFKTAGIGTITRVGDGVIVSIKPTKVADARCLQFYGQNMHLSRVGKK